MRRRDFITLLGGAAAARPLAAQAQQVALPVIGFLQEQSASRFGDRIAVFRQGLAEAGYEEGRSVAIDYRWADDHNERLPALAADLAARQVAVIVAFNVPAIAAARAATKAIPIIFYTGADPVALGLVASLSRPGGNLTGATTLNVELGPKRLQTLHELAPAATDIAVLVNPANPNNTESQSRAAMEAAASSLGLRIHFVRASTSGEIDTAFAHLQDIPAGALLIEADAFLTSRNQQLAALAIRHALPAMGLQDFAALGGLVSYGAGPRDAIRLVGVYAGRVLKGEKPADMPVQQATKFELVINLKTAKVLDLSVPLPLSGGADEVIE